MYLCGAGSLPREDDAPWPPSTPRVKRRRGSNPYAARGLEKFTMVLADLETRREKIMAAAGLQGVPVVQFMYSDSQDWIPIVVGRQEQRPESNPGKGHGGAPKDQPAVPPPSPQRAEKADAEDLPDRVVKKSFSGRHGDEESGGMRSLLGWNRSYYWPAVVVLILLCLATFGRVFAICCTSAWWYAVPGGKGGECGGVRRSRREYGRRMSDKRLGGGGGVYWGEEGRRRGRADGA